MRGGVVFAFILLAARLVWVQGIMRTELQEKADRRVGGAPSAAVNRRMILDRNGTPIVDNVQVYSCYADPTLIRDRAGTARLLSAAFRMDERAVEKKLAARRSFVWIRRDVPATIALDLKEKKIPGIAFRLETRRHYPLGPLASHLVGMVGFDGYGLCGIEQAFESTLSAPAGAPVASGKLPAGHVRLTIDAPIQRIVERELDWGARKSRCKRAMALVQDPWTGEILAMASWPEMSVEPDRPPKPGDMRVPAMIDTFEPGSTFKVVVAAASVEENVIKRGETLSGENGHWKVYDRVIHDQEPRATLTLDDILTYSSNIGSAKLADRLGAERLYQYARLFGFGVLPGSCMPFEAKGTLRPLSRWSGMSKYTVAFGQEVSVTALQLVDAYSAIANGGRLMEPRIVSAIIGEDGEPAWTNPPAEVRRVVSERTAAEINRILTLVVTKGTGANAAVQWDPSMQVAGKTGTAQKYDPKIHAYSSTLTTVSFCGFFPAAHPRYTMVVIMDEPEGKGWGAVDAAPVFRRIAEQLMPKIAAARSKTADES